MRTLIGFVVLAGFVVGCTEKEDNDTTTTTPTLDTNDDPTDNPTDPTDDPTDDPTEPVSPEGYYFSRDGGDSVAYSGQVFRNLLIHDMKSYLGGLTDDLNAGRFPAAGEIDGELRFYFDFDSSVGGELDHLYDGALQTTYNDVSSDKDLRGKLAGNDGGYYKDWNDGVSFKGWSSGGGSTPTELIETWMQMVDDQAVAWGVQTPVGPDGSPVPAVYVTPEGHDLQQLLEKFLRGGVALSQAADDYTDNGAFEMENGKGLYNDHSAVVEGQSYTALEHAWDEGWGYFGGSRDFGFLTLDEVSDGGVDTDGDGAFDLLSETCVGVSVNTAKRDNGAVVATNFMADAWDGWYGGRQLLASTTGPLTSDEMDTLVAHRDKALNAWEGALAATAVHYVNDTLQDMGNMGTVDYSFADHAKHWSELKGFALGLQFNPHTPMTEADFVELHALIGDAPVLETAGEPALTDYKADLVAARALLGAAYGFDEDNLGDVDGYNGW